MSTKRSSNIEDRPKQWSAERKVELVLRLLRGESLDALSEETAVSKAQLSKWRDTFVAAGKARLKRRTWDRGTVVHLAWIAAILAIALATRTLWVVYAPADPTDGRRLDDTAFYHATASALAEGKGYVNPWSGAHTAKWPPGYPFFLAGLYWLFGASVTIGWIANIIFGSLTCVAVYILGCFLLNQRVGAIAGLLLAIFPGHIFFSSLLLSEILFTFLIVIAMILIFVIARDRDNLGLRRVVLLGIVVGVASLVRGQGLLLVFIAPVFWWLHVANWKRALQRAALVGLTCIAVIVPWSIRNYVTMRGLVLLSTNVGLNLYTGNHDRATGGFLYNTYAWIVEMYNHLPPEEREVAANNAALQEGLRYMVTHPSREARLVVSKLFWLYRNDEEGLHWISAPEVAKPMKSLRMWANIGNGLYFAVLVLSIGGLLWWVRRPRGALALPLTVIIMFTAGQMLFFTIPRFHLPLLPSFCLLTAAAVEHARSWAKARRRATS